MQSKTGWAAVLLLLSCFTAQSSQALMQDYQVMTTYGVVESSARIITYFSCSFAYEGSYPYVEGNNFPTIEPCGYDQHEKGTWHWVVIRRPREPNGGNMRLVGDPANASRLSLETILDYPGPRPLPDTQDVKLYELQHLDSENYVEPYPTKKEAYYQFKIRLPSDFEVGDWRNVWQICGEYNVYGNPQHTMAPQIALMFVRWGYDSLILSVADYYFQDGSTRRFPLVKIAQFPKNRWVTIGIYAKQASAFRSLDGTITVWIDGAKVFERNDIPTATYSGTPYVVWGIGNYGSKLEPYGQKIWFKDVMVTSEYTGF